jgi:hypothetical protein
VFAVTGHLEQRALTDCTGRDGDASKSLLKGIVIQDSLHGSHPEAQARAPQDQ